MISSKELRRKWLDFYISKGHTDIGRHLAIIGKTVANDGVEERKNKCDNRAQKHSFGNEYQARNPNERSEQVEQVALG